MATTTTERGRSTATYEPGAGGRAERGASAVELALVLPLLLAVAMGIFSFGVGYSAKLTLNAGVREGARTLALGGTDDQAILRVKQLTVKLKPALVDSDVSVDSRCPLGDLTSKAQISATYPVSYDFLVARGTWRISATSVMRCGG